jgi:capsular polysaccharide transport system permease protein
MSTPERLDDRSDMLQPAAESPLARAARISQALSEVARRQRFATGRYPGIGGGLGARRGERRFWLSIKLSFLALVVVPSVAAMVYFAFIASDQYVSETRFTVAGGVAPATDGIGSMTGVPSLQTFQDTQVVVNYVESQGLVDELSHRVDLRAIFARSDADWIARLPSHAPIEKLVRYWKWMTDVSVSLPGGIITFAVRAFRPEDARAVASGVLALSEKMVNNMNDRMRRDTVALATSDLQLAGDRLKVAGAALEGARNEEKMLDAKRTADSLSSLRTGVLSAKIRLQQEYDTRLKFISPQTSQMRNLRARLDAADVEIAKIESQMTAKGDGLGRTLSASMTTLEGLELERQIAEDEYSNAAVALERAQIASEAKLIYLNQFVEPVTAEEARYPRRFAWTAAIVAGSLFLWSILVGVAVLVRNHRA